ncbi:hypothetical protein BSKO_13298 [Bryopsis sp. KO-2023]|nr:hypothetical protein BSKO_13298 [Bryopsis sp. KO-2023]
MQCNSFPSLGQRGGLTAIGARRGSLSVGRPQLRTTPNRRQTFHHDMSQGAFLRNLFRPNSNERDLPQAPSFFADIVDKKPKKSVDGEEELSDSVPASELSPTEAAFMEAVGSVSENETTDSETVVEDLEEEEEPEEEDPYGLEELFQEVTSPEKLGRSGEGWLLGLAATLVVILIPPFNLTGLLAATGFLTFAAGCFFVGYGVLSCGRSISPLPYPRENGELVVDGMYAYVRHPIYGGLILAAGGLAAMLRSEVRFVLTFLLYWVVERVVAVEEKALQQKYAEYADYKSSTKKLFPFLY